MIVASLFSLQLVAVLDQTPLVQINGSFGGWLGQSLLTLLQLVCCLCGMSAALGAFFGAPLVAHSLPWNSSPRTEY